MKKIKGDLIALAQAGEFDVIVHGCNCVCVMEAGLARAVSESFPSAYRADQDTIVGDFRKLGRINATVCPTTHSFVYVINAYIQQDVIGEQCLADYDALSSCMRLICEQYGKKRIGLPRIGSGLAGGDWSIIEKIIEKELAGCDVTIVEYEK